MKKLNIIVVGPGLIGRTHIKLINENNETNLAGVVAPSSEHNQLISTNLDVPLFNNLVSAIDNLNPDGVIISSPNEFHYEQAVECINNSIPVLIEKPITTDLFLAKKIVDLSKSQNSKVLIGHHRAHSPIMKKAKNIIESGKLGGLVSIVASAQFHKPSHYFEEGPWRTKKGGGPIMINLIHEIGNMRYLMGEISRVHAFSTSSNRGYEVEDTVAINLIFENGSLGTFLLSDAASSVLSWEQTSQENKSYASYPDEDCYKIAGKRGCLSIPSMKLKYYADLIEPSWWSPMIEEQLKVINEDPLKCQLANFIEVIRGDSNPIVNAEDGMRNLSVLDAINLSIQTNTSINL